ncbi:MAG: YncE family protein [Solirubrobacteraceae bacterium]
MAREHPHRRRRSAIALGAVAFVGLCLLAASCDDGHPATDVNHQPGTETTATTPADPKLPFPPTADEPATSAGHAAKPAGTVVTIGGRPEGVAVDSASDALGVSTDDAAHDFAIYDARTLALRRTVTLASGARHVTASGDGRFLVPLEGAATLASVPAAGTAQGAGNASASTAPTSVTVGDHPHNVLVVGRDTLVANEYGDSVTVIRDGKVRATVPVDVQPGGMADVGNGQVAVISVRAYTVELLDLETLTTGPSQNAGYGPSHAVGDPMTGRAFVVDTRGGNLLTYATRPRLKFTGRLHLGGSPYGIAFDATRARLWLTDSGADRLYEISTTGTPRVIKTFPTVRQPNTVAVDPSTGAAIVAGEARGQLERITP